MKSQLNEICGRLRFFPTIIRVLITVLIISSSSFGQTTFKDCSEKLGIKLENSAAGWGDFNNDGFTDLCAGSTVWRNNSGKSFTKLSEAGSGVLADFDNDGFIDMFSYSQHKLFRNIKGTELAKVNLPELPNSSSRGACWADFNKDGYVDIYIGGYENWNEGITYPDLMLTNVKGKSLKVSWNKVQYRSRGVTACDFDRDADVDIYVSNYRLQPNELLLNDGGGKYIEAAVDYNVVATSTGFGGGHSIGACWGDFDNDGYIDLFAGNFAHRDSRGDQPKSRFLKNTCSEKNFIFQDLGPCGIYYQESYASPAAGDFDNDGDLDLFFTTVYATASFNKKNFPVLFCNNGDWTFSDVTGEVGLSNLPATYQAGWADFDNDGDLDLVTAGRLFVNQGNLNNWLKIRLQGDGRKVNRSAVGSQVRIKLKEKTLCRQVEAGTGEGNQNDLTIHFGLGKQKGPVNIEIFWPDGTEQVIKEVQLNQLIEVRFYQVK